MRLLLDQNISFRLPKRLKDLDITCMHVKDVDLTDSNDLEIWNYAKSNDLAIVTFDSDFRDLGLMKGTPPKIIWIRTGNLTTSNIEKLVRSKIQVIQEFLEDEESKDFGVLELSE